MLASSHDLTRDSPLAGSSHERRQRGGAIGRHETFEKPRPVKTGNLSEALPVVALLQPHVDRPPRFSSPHLPVHLMIVLACSCRDAESLLLPARHCPHPGNLALLARLEAGRWRRWGRAKYADTQHSPPLASRMAVWVELQRTKGPWPCTSGRIECELSGD
jgi:hypothetical protein